MMRRAVLLLLASCAVEQPAVTASVEQHAAVCADGPTTFGIDVSRFQGTIDWQKVANADVKFAYIQISRSLTDLDVKFDYNWKRAKEVGILRGAYQRFQPDQDVLGQANLFLDKLGPFQAGDLPPLLDVEDAKGLGPTVIASKVRQWIDRVEAVTGVKPIIYTGFYFWRDSVGSADFSEYPLWIANYGATCPLVPDHWPRWTFHQYSSTVTLPGITANTVDVNKFNGTLAQLKALAAPAVCGDGACNGVETADSCPAECAPCQMIAGLTGSADEHIVDDASACFRAGGDPQFIRTEPAGYGSSLQWTHATDLAAPANYAQWTLHFAEAGRYRVEAFTPAPFNGSRMAVYQVTHGSETTEAQVDQSAVDGWNVIGEFDFVAGGAGQTVRLDDNTGEPNSANVQLVFDALRFTPITPGEPDPEPHDGEPDPTSPGGGCSSSGAPGGGWLVALGLLAMRLRQRARRR